MVELLCAPTRLAFINYELRMDNEQTNKTSNGEIFASTATLCGKEQPRRRTVLCLCPLLRCPARSALQGSVLPTKRSSGLASCWWTSRPCLSAIALHFRRTHAFLSKRVGHSHLHQTVGWSGDWTEHSPLKAIFFLFCFVSWGIARSLD